MKAKENTLNYAKRAKKERLARIFILLGGAIFLVLSIAITCVLLFSKKTKFRSLNDILMFYYYTVYESRQKHLEKVLGLFLDKLKAKGERVEELADLDKDNTFWTEKPPMSKSKFTNFCLSFSEVLLPRYKNWDPEVHTDSTKNKHYHAMVAIQEKVGDQTAKTEFIEKVEKLAAKFTPTI